MHQMIIFVAALSAEAYIDPGTGGMIIGTSAPVFGVIAAAVGAFLLKYFWNPIKKLVRKIFKR
ncbi:MAG: hypothetical protein ABH879_08745 [archaeon]